jgi:hypothetical protein
VAIVRFGLHPWSIQFLTSFLRFFVLMVFSTPWRTTKLAP